MLKRNGEARQHSVPGFAGKLTRAELDSYNEAFDTIKSEFEALEQIKNQVKELAQDAVIFTIPADDLPVKVVETDNKQFGNVQWIVRSSLLKLNRGQIFLCERPTDEGQEFAVIHRMETESPYGQANGGSQLLLTGNDPVILVQDYAANAEHTLRFMACNMVATAQEVVWRRFANSNPSQVVRAISERCAKVVHDLHSHSIEEPFEQNRLQASGGNRIKFS
jgi:hypothetical protein